MISRMFKWSIIADFYFYTVLYFLGSKYFFHKTFFKLVQGYVLNIDFSGTAQNVKEN